MTIDITLDFSGVTPDEFTLLPKGTYDCEIVKVQLKTSKEREGVPGSGGSPYLNFELKIIEGEYEGRRLWAMAGMQSKKSKEAHIFVMGKLLALLQSFGITEDQVRFVADPEDDNRLIEPDLEGMICRAKVGVDTKYDPDNPKNKVLTFSGTGGTNQPPAVEGEAVSENGSAVEGAVAHTPAPADPARRQFK